MRCQFYHALFAHPNIDSLPRAMADVGLHAQGWAERASMVRDLERRRLVAKSDFRPDPRLRSFARRDGSAAAFLMVNDWLWSATDPNREEVDLMIWSETGDCDAIAGALGHALDLRFRAQTFGDCSYARQCTSHMTGLSSNGRLLLDPEIRQAADAAADDTFRDAWRSPAPGDRTRPEAYAVRQGLWLEWLTYRALARHSSFVWHGVMAAGSELDAVAVAHENVLIAECKDSSLGLNDFVVAVHKARRVAADVLLLVTTRELHSNVQAAIEEHHDDEDADPIPCTVLSVVGGTGETVQEGVRDKLAELTAHGMKNWFAGRRITMAHPLYYATNNDW